MEDAANSRSLCQEMALQTVDLSSLQKGYEAESDSDY